MQLCLCRFQLQPCMVGRGSKLFNYYRICYVANLAVLWFRNFFVCVYVSETLRQNASKRIICNVRASQRTVVVLTNFYFIPHLKAYRKNSSNDRRTFSFNKTLPWFDELFSYHICEFQTIVKFVKITSVRQCRSCSMYV